jgi:tripartite-type tricarboxylate transporter receptor subunit TctC
MRLLFAALAAIGLCVSPAKAQPHWPQRQVTIVVPFAAGGSADLLARILQQHLQAQTGVPIVVENKGGAGGSIGAGYVAKAPPDGATLLIGTASTNAINAFLYTHLNFDVARDFQAVTLLVRFPNLLFVNPRIPAKTVPELVAWLKANPGKVNYGSSGLGTSSHLSMVMFELATGTSMTHIPFRSTAEVVNSMLGGQIDLATDSMTTTWPFAQGGQIRAIAVTTPRRCACAPDLPTVGETLKGSRRPPGRGCSRPPARRAPWSKRCRRKSGASGTCRTWSRRCRTSVPSPPPPPRTSSPIIPSPSACAGARW